MRIWVTGVGIVSPLAASSRATLRRLHRAECAFGPVSLFDTAGQRAQIAAEVPNLRVRDVAPRGIDPATWSRTDAFAVAAAHEALTDARITPADRAVDLVVGTTTGATFETEERLADLLEDASADRLTPAIIHPLELVLEHVASALGPFRRRRLVSSACSTGANAILLGAAWIRAGLGSCVLAGASDSLCRLTFTGFNALGSLDPNPCRPFDEARNGLGLGEGAAFVVLESDTAARERGATPIAELAGWAAGAEAHHITNPEASGSVAARVMREALTRAELGAEDVDYVNAHGTATPLNDPMEVRAVRTALGSAFDAAVISSIKGQIGHSLGAAGAVETAVTALCVSDGRVPPTGGLASPAEDCQANHVIGAARELTIRAALSNSFGFGGLDGVIAVTRPEYPPEQEARTQRRIHVGGGAVTTPEGVQSLRALPLRPPQSPPRGPLPPEVTGSFDPRRGRRLGKGERLLAAVIDAAGAVSSDVVPGLVVSKPSGNPDATSRFMDRIRKRGPRFASPADFPNLMLSSLAGHASIYHRLQGPALTTSARRGGGLCSLRTAWELLVAGMDAPLFTGAADPWGMAADSDDLPRAECAAAVLLSAHDTEAASSGASFAALQLVEDLETLPPPSGDARLLTCDGADPAVLEPSPWATVPLHAAEDWFGASHAVTVAAVNTAAAWVARGACDQVLVLAMEEGPVIAILVERP